MTNTAGFEKYEGRLRQFMAQALSDKSVNLGRGLEERFNDLALELFGLQFEENAAYRKLCLGRGITGNVVRHWTQIPVVPTDAFKEQELTSLSENERTTVFHSSGTTGHRPSRHFHSAQSLALYEASLLPWFRSHILPGLGAPGQSGPRERDGATTFLILTPSPSQAPHSSLVHMFETVRREFGSRRSMFGGRIDSTGMWDLDEPRIESALGESVRSKQPVTVLGTAFSFLRLLDKAGRRPRYELPAGSCALETGGYKGRSRVLPKPELRALITECLGIPRSHIIGEYGMSELSSQAYDGVAGHAGTEEFGCCFCFPPWARARIVSPETGGEVMAGETGLICVFDLANVRSVLAVRTGDLGIRRGANFELIGRAPATEPRGCSLMSV